MRFAEVIDLVCGQTETLSEANGFVHSMNLLSQLALCGQAGSKGRPTGRNAAYASYAVAWNKVLSG
jgi:hypothetical protein